MQYVIPAALLARIPVRIHTVHSIADKEVSKTQRKLHSLFYNNFKVTPVSISPLVKKSVIKEYSFLDNQVPMIYNGIDLERFIPRGDYQESKDIVNIIHVGRFSKEKIT